MSLGLSLAHSWWYLALATLQQGVVEAIDTNHDQHLRKACVDTPGWINPYGHPCIGGNSYQSHGWCRNGAAVPGKERTLGSKYYFPEDNCCICGKEEGRYIKYLETQYGKKDCPKGWKPIATERECFQAKTEMEGKGGYRQSSWTNIQGGCFSHANQAMWWNSNPNGQVHRSFSSICVKAVTTTTTTTTQGPTTTTTTTTTSPPFWATWVKGPQGDNCILVCGEHKCLENQWPTSLGAFQKILKEVGDETCASVDTGDWAVNPGQYHDYDNACYWSTTVTDIAILQTRCAQSNEGISRYCPCAARPSTTTTSTTTTLTTTTTTVQMTSTHRPSTTTRIPRPPPRLGDLPPPRTGRRRRRRGNGATRRRGSRKPPPSAGRRRRRRGGGAVRRRNVSKRRRRRRNKSKGGANIVGSDTGF